MLTCLQLINFKKIYPKETIPNIQFPLFDVALKGFITNRLHRRQALRYIFRNLFVRINIPTSLYTGDSGLFELQ